MKNINTIKWFYYLTHFLFVLFNITFGVFVILGFLIFTNLIPTDNLQFTTALPVAFNFTNHGIIEISEYVQEIEIINSVGKIKFINTYPVLAKYFIVALSVVMVIFYYILYSFRNFIKNIYKNEVFEIENIKYLKNISYALFVGWIYYILYVLLFSYILVANIELSGVTFVSDIQFHSEFLFVAAFLWIIAHIIELGLNLKNDNKLTI